MSVRQRQEFTKKLNSFIIDSDSPKDNAKYWASFMKHQDWLLKGTRISYYREGRGTLEW